jgi:hypothetical protein
LTRTLTRPLFARFSVALHFWICLLLLGCGSAPQSTPPIASSERVSREDMRRETTPSSDRYDLESDEQHGGHTLDKHVGRTDGQLRERLEREPRISAASTWTDLDTAETVVAEALRVEHYRVEKWTARGYPRANLALHFDARRPVGRSLRRGDSQTVECTGAVIVLRATGPDTSYVLTTYPEARE